MESNRLYQRADSVTHRGRQIVPTTGDIIWVDTIAAFVAAGGKAVMNEDQTELYLHLPEKHKFSVKFFDVLKA